MTRPRTLVTSGLAMGLMVILSACSETTTGTASPTGSAVSAATPPTSSSRPQIPTDQPQSGSSSSHPSAAPSALTGISPCSVVPPSTVADFGGSGAGDERKLGIGRDCSWRPAGKPVFGVTFYDTTGVKDAVGSGPQVPVKVGTGAHEAMQQDGGGVCLIEIAMGTTSRADVSVATAASACEKAKTLADAVEPLLPPQVK